MISLIQRVSEAAVDVDGKTIGAIETGILALVAIEPDDGEPQLRRMRDRLLGYRIFPDAEGRMNRSIIDIDGGLLLVPQFTLAADTRKGMRPSFASAAAPEDAQRLFAQFLALVKKSHARVENGQFGAHMMVRLVNDGPVTFTLIAR